MMASEKRLIDATPFMKDGWHLVKTGESNVFITSISLADVSTVDAVPVVRCRDCIGRSTWYNDAEYGCAVCGMSGMYPKSESGYCSYGLRRRNETD